jgi:hypothetical protein
LDVAKFQNRWGQMNRKNINRGIPEENNHAPKPVYIKLYIIFQVSITKQKLHKETE